MVDPVVVANAGTIRVAPMVGTAGWSIPKEVATRFPSDGPHLERYAKVMNAAEINSSFHRPHQRTTYERWASSVPETFRFSVKIPKAISHTARLVDTDGVLDAFLQEVGGLGDKLEIVLLQLPPSLAFDHAVAASFLGGLTARLDGSAMVACEPRHPSWFTSDVDTFLAERGVARAAADPVLVASGETPGGWTGLRNHRLHGSPRVYYSSYADAALNAIARTVDGHAQSGASSWCIFDNTASGAAASDALALRHLLEADGVERFSPQDTARPACADCRDPACHDDSRP